MAVQYYEGIGRRKESTARVRIMSGAGNFTINGKTLEDYFPRLGELLYWSKAVELPGNLMR
jgi:small subunit ribosomal protein S9